MNYENFQSLLEKDTPPPGLSNSLKALWFDAKGEWEKAHTLIQDASSGDEAWVHAYLHRKEGDTWNADYWYRRAGKSRPNVSLDEEWQGMVRDIRDDQPPAE